MITGFEWLNSLMQWFGAFFPRMKLLQINQGAIKFLPRARAVVLPPGRLYWYWPLTTNVKVVPTARDTLVFGSRLTTRDGKAVQIGVVVIYHIEDVYKALVDTVDVEATIAEASQRAAATAVSKREFSALQEEMAENPSLRRNELKAGCAQVLRQFGVEVEDAFLSDYSKTTVFSHDGQGMVAEPEEKDEE